MGESFAELLRRHRLRGRLTQESLAERAGISARSIGAMERGSGRTPRPRNVERLAAALGLDGGDRADFLAAGQARVWADRGAGPAADRGTRTPAVDAPPRQLPPDVADFVGRADELAVLARVLDPDAVGAAVVAVSGPAGMGKTALAVHAGHRFAARFPDGQLYAALGGGTGTPADVADVLAQLLRALGLDGAALPAGVDARAALFRTRTAGRRLLVVLDDAAGHHQVAPLLPARAAAVLVTSRLPLTGLPGATTVDLPPLPGRVAIELLCRVAGADRVRAERPAADDLVAACGNLPLAVRIVAARLAARPHWTIGALAGRIIDERRRLDELRHGDLAVRPGLEITHRALGPAAARAFALLGALGVASFPEWVVAALLGVAPPVAAAALDELLDARLLEAAGTDPAGQARYRFHEVTRLFARECREACIGEPELVDAVARAAAGWLALARVAQERLHCERFHLDDRDVRAELVDARVAAVAADRPVEWFEAERGALGTLVEACAGMGLAALARSLTACGAEFYELRAYYDDWCRTTRAALAACREAGDRPGAAAMLRGLGTCLVERSDWAGAEAALLAARAAAEEVGDPAGAAMARKDHGFMLGLTGRLDEAAAELSAAADALGAVDHPAVRAVALTSLGFVRRQAGDLDGAVRCIDTALDVARRSGDRFVEAYASRGLAGALLAGGRHAAAERAARRAAELFGRIGDPIGAAQSLRALGEALAHDPCRLHEAEHAFGAAAREFLRRGDAWGCALTELSLGETQLRHGGTDADAHLRHALDFWTRQDVPALRARTLVALSDAAERAGDPAARPLLTAAYELFRELGAPAADGLAERLGLAAGTAPPAAPP